MDKKLYIHQCGEKDICEVLVNCGLVTALPFYTIMVGVIDGKLYIADKKYIEDAYYNGRAFEDVFKDVFVDDKGIRAWSKLITYIFALDDKNETVYWRPIDEYVMTEFCKDFSNKVKAAAVKTFSNSPRIDGLYMLSNINGDSYSLLRPADSNHIVPELIKKNKSLNDLKEYCSIDCTTCTSRRLVLWDGCVPSHIVYMSYMM